MKKKLKEVLNKSKASIFLLLVVTTFFVGITAISSDFDNDFVDINHDSNSSVFESEKNPSNTSVSQFTRKESSESDWVDAETISYSKEYRDQYPESNVLGDFGYLGYSTGYYPEFNSSRYGSYEDLYSTETMVSIVTDADNVPIQHGQENVYNIEPSAPSQPSGFGGWEETGSFNIQHFEFIDVLPNLFFDFNLTIENDVSDDSNEIYYSSSFTEAIDSVYIVNDRIKFFSILSVIEMLFVNDTDADDYKMRTAVTYHILMFNFISGEYDDFCSYTPAVYEDDFYDINIWFEYVRINQSIITLYSIQSQEGNYRIKKKNLDENIIQYWLKLNELVGYCNYTFHLPLEIEYSHSYPDVFQWVDETSGDYDSYCYISIQGVYDIYFYSGVGFGRDYTREAQLVALKDSSNDYLQNIGFEGSYSDWKNHYTSPFDSIALNTTIVSEGAFSLRLEDSDGSNDYLHLSDSEDSGMNYDSIPSGYYYISFDYYVESTTAGAFRFEWYDGDFQSITLETSTTDRWITQYVYIHVVDSTYHIVRFFGTSWSGILFIDDFKIWKSSVEAKTTAYSETEFTATFIDWNTYQTVSNLDVEFDLRDRTADSSVDTFSTTTDSSGKATWVWKGHLDSKEYEIRSYSKSSKTGRNTNFETNDLATYYSQVSGTANNSISSDAARTGNYGLKIGDGGQHQLIGLLYPSHTNPEWIAETYAFSFWYKISGGTGLYIKCAYSDGTTSYVGDETYYGNTPTTTWTQSDTYFFDHNLTNGHYCIYSVRYDNTYSQWTYVDDIALSPVSKSYFTPLTSGYLDYFESEAGNAVDFSEETEEDLTFGGGASQTRTASKGCLNVSVTGTSASYSYIRFDISLDASYYNYYIIRLKSNNDTLRWTLGDADGHGLGYQSLTTNYAVYSGNMPSWWSGIETQLRIFFYESDGENNFDGDEKYYIDYIQLVHRDSSLSSGYAWEFEEDSHDDGWDVVVSCTATANQGNLHAAISSSVAYCIVKNDNIEQSWSGTDWDYILLKMRASGSEIFLERFYADTESYFPSSGSRELSTSWQYYLFSLSSFSNSHSELGLRFDESDGTLDSGDWIDIAYVRLLEDTEPNLYETTTQFFTSSENDTLQYRFWQDNQFAGDYSDIESIEKNLTVGSHNIVYAAFSDLDAAERVYLPSACYYYSYEVTDAFYIQSSWSVSDSTYHLQVTPSHACSYQIYVNESSAGSGSVPTTGSTISGVMQNDPGLYLVNISFTYSGSTAWANNSYSVPELSSWSFEKEIDFDLLDQQCSVTFKTDWNNLSGYVYENSTYKGSFNDGETFTWQRNTDYSYVRNVTAVLWDGSTNTSFAWFYRNEDANTLFIRMYPVKIDSDRITISVASNWEAAIFDINDNATAGTEVSGELAGTFVFTRTSSYGVYEINVTGYYDFNNNGTYDTNEKETIVYYYSIYEEALVLEEQSSVSFIDRKASIYFKSNYYDSNRSQFRVLSYNSSDYTSWMYEKTFNGSYSWDITGLSDGYYCGVLEIRINITTSSGNQTIIYCPFDYYVYDNVANAYPIVGVYDNNEEQAAEIADLKEEIEDQGDQIEEQREQISGFSSIAKLLSTVFFAFICLYCYINRGELMKTAKRIVLGKRSLDSE
ncbi:MAG: hypothetical protein ACTSP4_00140 [Candidatus Hodarchaeales archaeon]